MVESVTQKSCLRCQSAFTLTEEDTRKLSKFDVPGPKLCPMCRNRRRLLFRNDRNYYARSCDLCKKEIISIYSEDKTFPVYCKDCFWSDTWDPTSYGVEMDFTRPFFEQFAQMRSKVPRIAIFNSKSENSDYTVHSGGNKNCYMCSSLVDSQDTHYSDWAFYCKDSMDVYMCQNMELCYYCFASEKCYSGSYLEMCENINFSYYCFDCRGSSNLLGCVGLRGKTNYVLNNSVSKEEFEKYLVAFQTDAAYRETFLKSYEQLKLSMPKPHCWEKNCESCTGNYLANSRNATYCFDSKDLEDVRYGTDVGGLKDCTDVTRVANAEMLYECCGIIDTKFSKFCNLCYYSSNLQYCDNCQNSHDNFGCMSLKNNRNCILNKQYTPEEYERLMPQIVEHMKKTGEYGEFFPEEITVFGYNETKAQDYYRLTQAEATSQGFTWKEKIPRQYQPATFSPTDEKHALAFRSPQSIPDTIVNEILACERCTKNYKILPYELKFYRNQKIPLPTKCSDCRHYDRVAWQNPRLLWNRNCMKCQTEIQTSYAPDRKEIVYCNTCYLDTLL